MLYAGSCHCGKIAFEVEGEFSEALDCNCSFCRRRGALLAFVSRDKLKLKVPDSDMTTYMFNSHVVEHHFCATCGIALFGEGKAPGASKMAAVNLRCLPDIDLDGLTIKKFDGRNL